MLIIYQENIKSDALLSLLEEYKKQYSIRGAERAQRNF